MPDLRTHKSTISNLLHYQSAISGGLIVSDMIALALSFGFALIIIPHQISGNELGVLGLFIILYFIAAFRLKIYAELAIKSPLQNIARPVFAIIAAVCATTLTLVLLGSQTDRVNMVAPGYLIIFMALTIISRLIISRIFSGRFKETLFNHLMILDDVIVETPQGFRAINASERGIIPDPDDPLMRHWAALTIDGADHVIIACPPNRQKYWIRFLRGSNVRIEMLIPDPEPEAQADKALVKGYVCVDISTRFLNKPGRAFKRAFDILIAITLLVLFGPFMLFCAVIIKYADGGPILFTQIRVGYGNQLFNLYKFRTMATASADPLGTLSVTRGDARITRFGRLLRSTSLDELPQLLNVLKGEMSLVGPRPHAIGSLVRDKLFWEVDDEYWHRHAMKPGITGLAQIRGFRGSTIFEADLTNRLHSDLEYLHKWSLWRDLTILLSTVRIMVHKNAY